MKKGFSVLAAFVLAVLLVLGWRYFGGSTVPAGQPELVRLAAGNFDELRTAFDAATGKVRIVLLLSPT
jgi:predicted negative regulator of RcsB-dependent stress response